MSASAKIPMPLADAVADIGADDPVPPIFPCNEGAKTPATPKGFKNYARTHDDLKRFAEQNPSANIGLFLEAAGLCVIDIDGAQGEETWSGLELEHGIAAPTYEVRTPRGRHLYFRGSLPATTKKLGPKIDTRGRDSYVLAAGSIVDGKTYTITRDVDPAPLPEWIAKRLARSVEPQTTAPNVPLDQPRNVDRAIVALQARAPAIQGQGGDDWTYQTAAIPHDLGCSEEKTLDLMLEHYNPRCIPPWTEDELAQKVQNAFEYAQNAPGAYALPPLEEIFAHIIPTAQTDASREASDYPRPLTAAELASGDYPPPDYLIPNLILRKHVNLLYGDGGVGKTTLALNLAVAIAAGRTFPAGADRRGEPCA